MVPTPSPRRDVDGDGDLDVLSASLHDDTVAWYENDGSGNFTTRTITTTADGVRSVTTADLDGDGDLDILSASFHDDTITWYEQTQTTFTEGGSAVVLDADVDISDPELDALNGGNGNYDGTSLTLVRDGRANNDDVLSFNDGNGITLSSGTLIKNSQIIATFDTTTTSDELVISFTDANGEIPTSADVDNILRQLTYANSSDDPPASVQLDWTFDDGNTGSQGSGGSLNAAGGTTVDITGVNDEQVLSTNVGDTVAEGSTGNAITNLLLQTTDVDNTDSQLVYTVDMIPANGTLRLSGSALANGQTFTQTDIVAGLVTYDHDGSQTPSDSFDFTVDDGTGTTTSNTFNWTVSNVNDAPLQSGIEGGALAYAENDGVVAITSTLAITDVDDTDMESAVIQITGNYVNGDDLLTFANQNGISSVWNAGSGTLTLAGTASNAFYETALRMCYLHQHQREPKHQHTDRQLHCQRWRRRFQHADT